MSLLTIGGRNDGPLKDITNSVVETPRTSFNKTKTRNPEVGFAPKKSNNDSPTQLSTTGRRLQFEDENTLQSINIRPPNDIQDRSKCIRKKYQAENQVYHLLILFDS